MSFGRLCLSGKSQYLAQVFEEKGQERLKLFKQFVDLGCDKEDFLLEVEQSRVGNQQKNFGTTRENLVFAGCSVVRTSHVCATCGCGTEVKEIEMADGFEWLTRRVILQELCQGNEEDCDSIVDHAVAENRVRWEPSAPFSVQVQQSSAVAPMPCM